tara:strand:+ start:1057 stop:1278 length:222 start_codon:yes stop_codon:yes gene_type:complete
MKIVVFGNLSKELGWKEKKISWEERMTPEKIWQREIKLKINQVRPALNFKFCKWDESIPKNSELAFLPPMSGG